MPFGNSRYLNANNFKRFTTSTGFAETLYFNKNDMTDENIEENFINIENKLIRKGVGRYFVRQVNHILKDFYESNNDELSIGTEYNLNRGRVIEHWNGARNRKPHNPNSIDRWSWPNIMAPIAISGGSIIGVLALVAGLNYYDIPYIDRNAAHKKENEIIKTKKPKLVEEILYINGIDTHRKFDIGNNDYRGEDVFLEVYKDKNNNRKFDSKDAVYTIVLEGARGSDTEKTIQYFLNQGRTPMGMIIDETELRRYYELRGINRSTFTIENINNNIIKIPADRFRLVKWDYTDIDATGTKPIFSKTIRRYEKINKKPDKSNNSNSSNNINSRNNQKTKKEKTRIIDVKKLNY